MPISRVALAALAYILVTFPLALVWHLGVFAETYDQLGYIERQEPLIPLGFAAILLQGLLMATAFAAWTGAEPSFKRAGQLVSLFGAYHWTTHVLAAAAKQAIEPLTTWFALETTYLLLQFALFAPLLTIAFRARRR